MDITEHDLIFKALQEKVRALAALHATSLDITTPHELPDLLSKIIKRATRLLNASCGALYLCQPEREQVHHMVSFNLPADFVGTVLDYGEGAAGRVAQSGKALIIDDYQSWSGRAKDYEQDKTVRSVVSAPMNWQGKVIGVIQVAQTENKEHFSEDDLNLLNLFANQAAIAVENSRLYERMQIRVREAETLRKASAVVAETLQQDEAISLILQQLDQVVPHDSASVQLLGDGYLEIVGGHGWADQNAVVGLRFPVPSQNPNTIVIQSRKPLILKDASAVYPSFRDGPHHHIHAWMGIPLIVHGEVIGMLAVDSKDPNYFDEGHARLAAAFADQVAVALKNARLYAIEQRRVKELDALRATVADISAELELTNLLRAILERAANLLNATGGDLGLYDETNQEILIVVSHNMEKDYAGTRMALGEGAMGKAAETLQPLIIEDYQTWEGRSSQYAQGSWHAALTAPLLIGERLVGIIGIVDTNPDRRFSLSDQQLLNLFAQQAAIAVENARLYAAEKERAKELAILFESSAAITTSLDLPAVLGSAAEHLSRALNATSVYILSCDLESATARMLAEYFTPDSNELERVSDLDTIYNLQNYPQTLQALRAEQPWITNISDSHADPRAREQLEKFGGKSALRIPLLVSRQLVGYAVIWDSRSERDWSEEEIRLGQTLANISAIAIENARLFSEVHSLSITDLLTGLYNRRGLLELGLREVDRTRRFNRSISALLLDIDHFKRINDTFSHAIGDQVLRELADRCRKSVRKIDIIGRYGGEEFAILLPETDLSGAYTVAERLLWQVAHMPIETDRGPIAITISLGITSASQEIPDLAVLFDRADTAMYAAKRAGRNRIDVYCAPEQSQPFHQKINMASPKE